MANENINKVVYGNDTLIDLTNDSVSPQTLLTGTTAHDQSGAQITGQATQGHTIINASGISMDAESGLQFATMQVEDDSTNGKTVVRHIVELTQAQYDALPSSKLTDNIIYHITDQDANPLQASDITYGTSNVATELTNLNSGKVDTGAVSEYVETVGETAQGSYKVGDYFLCTDGYFYRCKSAITGGSTTITTNNAEQTTISKAITQSANYSTIDLLASSNVASWQGKTTAKNISDYSMVMICAATGDAEFNTSWIPVFAFKQKTSASNYYGCYFPVGQNTYNFAAYYTNDTLVGLYISTTAFTVKLYGIK